MSSGIIGYHRSSAVSATINMLGTIDYRFGNVFEFGVGSGNQGVRRFDAWPNGIEQRARTVADIGIPAVAASGAAAMLYNAQWLAFADSVGNSSAIQFLTIAELIRVGQFGADGSSLVNSTTNIESPTQLAAISDKFGHDYLLANTFNTDGIVNVVDPRASLASQLTLTNNTNRLGSIPDGSGSLCYILNCVKLGGATANKLYVYDANNGLSFLGSISPTQVDATWTNFSSSQGCAIDQTDGNVIVGFATTDSVVNKAYIAKLNKTNAAVMWAIPVGNGLAVGSQDMSRWLIQNGTVYYLSGTVNQLYTINTVAGTATTSTVDSLTLDGTHGSQVSEDVVGSIYVFGGWTEGTTHPSYFGDWMLVKGNHSGSAMLFRYFPVSAAPAPVVPTPAAASRKRAWTFTLDGHSFYVLDLATQGTFLYDTTTQEWCKFITAGAVQWNVAQGTQWGTRIVGGDLITTDVWELQPGALKDNGSQALDIVRTLTGGVATRNRIYHSVEAFRLTGSAGKLDDSPTAIITLRFSDDQGNNWSPYFSLTLTAANFSQEIAWRSLGAFSAPGRIFEIQDTGGLVRIDGADAGIDGFDDDGQQGGAGD